MDADVPEFDKLIVPYLVDVVPLVSYVQDKAPPLEPLELLKCIQLVDVLALQVLFDPSLVDVIVEDEEPAPLVE